MNRKSVKFTLISSLALATFGVSTVLAEENPVNQDSSSMSASELSAPVANRTVQVTSQELEDAKQAVEDAGAILQETAPQEQETVAAAEADNKEQAQALKEGLAAYQKEEADYAQAQENRQQALNQQLAALSAEKKAEYEANKAAFEAYQQAQINNEGVAQAEASQRLIYLDEPEATISLSGVSQYMDKNVREQHATDSILDQFNTDKYNETDFTTENPYDPREDVWFKMNVGDTVIATYENLTNSSFNNQKISKIMISYRLNSSTNTDGSAIVELFHNPTKTIFLGAQTSETGRNSQISVTMQLTFFDEAGQVIDLNKGMAFMGLGSLNHWSTSYGDHVEKVEIGQNEFIPIPGSSISLQNGAAYSVNDNQYKSNGATFNGDGEDGWDAVNENGKARAKTAYYGAGVMTYKGQPFTFTAGGNDQNMPTTIWFAINSGIALPQDPDADFNLPDGGQMPSLPVLSWHRNYVLEAQASTDPSDNNKVNPTYAKQFATADPSQTQTKPYKASLPQTGEENNYTLAALGFVAAGLAASAYLAGKKKEN